MQFPSFKEHKAHDSLLLRFDAISRNCARFLSQNAPMLVQFNIDAISLPLCATAWTAQMGPDIPGYFYVTCNFFFVIRPLSIPYPPLSTAIKDRGDFFLEGNVNFPFPHLVNAIEIWHEINIPIEMIGKNCKKYAKLNLINKK